MCFNFIGSSLATVISGYNLEYFRNEVFVGFPSSFLLVEFTLVSQQRIWRWEARRGEILVWNIYTMSAI